VEAISAWSIEMSDQTVLVVEDDPEINELVGAYAQIAGFDYRPALDGATALREAHEHVPSVVILDLMLPDIDGFEICSRLKEASDTHDVPVIILSALSDEANFLKGRACGASDYITKPFDPEKLMAALAKYAGVQQAN
jgi:DNA-binding response OmpR family regulator